MRWYLTDGTARPDHLPPGGIACSAGPLDLGPGLVIGSGPYVPQEPGWLPLAPGWAVHPDDGDPSRALRLAPIAGPLVLGAQPDQQWMVPRLLTPGPAGLECALPRVLTASGFEPPAQFADLLHRLREAVLRAGGIGDAELAELAIDILVLNYALTRAEIVALGWLTDQFGARILLAAAGLDDEQAAD
jgi:hypothetical protein